MIPTSFEKCRAYILAQPGGQKLLPENSLRPTITLARETGAGAITVGNRVAALLQEREGGAFGPWAVFDRNLVEKVLEDHDLPKRLEEFIIEDKKSLISDTVEDLLGLHPPASTLVGHTVQTMLRLGIAGGVVLVGRGAHLVMAGLPNALHVRLVAPLDIRIERVAMYFKMSLKEAEDYVTEADRARSKYVKTHFHADVEDPLGYDLVINTGRLTFEETAGLIADAATAHVKEGHRRVNHAA